jgi:hypothetical protein
MVDFARPRFRLGQTVATPAALEAIQRAGQSPTDFLDRHITGDWGDLSEDDREANESSLKDGSRILSAYHTTCGTKIWIVTEAADDDGQREATTILLPDEY